MKLTADIGIRARDAAHTAQDADRRGRYQRTGTRDR